MGLLIVIVFFFVIGGGGYLIWVLMGFDDEEIVDKLIVFVRDCDLGDIEFLDVSFMDVMEVGGIDFVYVNGVMGCKLLFEMMGGGVVFFDYDNDDDMDLLFVNLMWWLEDV